MKNHLNPSLFFKISGVIIFYFCTFNCDAQSIRRQSIASAGSSSLIDGISIQQTIGQSYFTSAYYDNESGLRPGFQQFSFLRVTPLNSFANLNLKVYPNPATNYIIIESEDVINNVSVQVNDLSGKRVINEKMAQLKTITIDCTTWSNGCYFIALYDENNNRYSSKLIITK